MKRPNLLWITVLLLGWVFDFLFWKHVPGLNFAIYVLLCLGGGLFFLLQNGHRPSWKSLLLLVPVLFFAVMTFVRQEPMSLFLGYVFTLGLMGLLAQTYLGGRWLKYSLTDHVVHWVKMIASMIARPIIFVIERNKQIQVAAEDQPSIRRSGWKRFWAVLRGLLIALPIIAIFAGLLSSADLVFAGRVRDFMELFRLERLPEYIFRALYILLGAYLLAGIFLHAAQKSQDEKLIGEDKPLVPAFLGFTEAVIVLGAVNLLFLLFVIIQFQYFFGGQSNITLEGFTYSEYARRGFGELVAVAFFSLLLFLGLSAVTKRENTARRSVFSGLGVMLVVLVGVMLFSAFQRLLLYEAAYGFSRLRMYTHIFMIWLGALLAVVVLLDFLHRERFFALAALAAAVGFAATLTLINVDGFIARQNVARTVDGEALDVPYLGSLSDDAVPVLASAFQDKAIPESTRDAIGAALVCHGVIHSSQEDPNWRSFTLSSWLADQALQLVQGKLDAYDVLDEEYPIEVLTPGSVYYECYQDWMD